VSVRIKNGADLTDWLRGLNADAIGFTAYSAGELASRSSSTFQVVSRFHEAIALITMMAGAIFIFALVLMRVEDQRKNLAILTVTGISKHTILKSLILESTFFAFFASLLGAGLGWISAQVVNLYYRHYYQTTLVFAEVDFRHPGTSAGNIVRAGCCGGHILLVPSSPAGSAGGTGPMKFPLYLAIRNLLRHPGRNVLYVLGVSITAALLLDMILLSSGLKVSLERVLNEMGWELRISPRGTLPFETDAHISGFRRIQSQLQDLTGAEAVDAMLAQR